MQQEFPSEWPEFVKSISILKYDGFKLQVNPLYTYIRYICLTGDTLVSYDPFVPTK